MKKFGTRLAALALAFVVAVSVGQVTAYASWALGSELSERTVPLGGGASLTSQSLWSASRGDLRTEHYVTYAPGGALRPVVFSGDYVASTNTVAAAAAQLKGQGLRVAAAVNGGWFNTDGTIVGMLVTDGVVRSLDVQNYALVGFTGDGQVFIDESPVTKTVSWALPDGAPNTVSLAGFNAYRNPNYLDGLYLYNKDFSSRVTAGGANVSALLRPVGEDGLRLNGSLTLEVLSVTDTTQEGVAFNGELPEGCYMLYAETRENNQALTDSLRALVPGQQVTVSAGGVSGRWADAAYGLSSLYPLLRDGQIVEGLPSSANPYTAVGVKADGSVVLYTIDGRQSGYSVGATYAQVAQRLQELGCVSAAALDGGGSTTLGATLPGSEGFSLVNRPSETGRRVNNTILLVTEDTGPTGEAAGAYVFTGDEPAATGTRVFANNQVVLTGAELEVRAQLYDTAGYPITERAAAWTATGGIVRTVDGKAIYSCIVPGDFMISASPTGEGDMPVKVVDELTGLTVRREDGGVLVGELRLSPGDEVELTASGSWWGLAVTMDDEDVRWSADAELGTISETGHFTAGQSNARGTITAKAGGQTAVIQVAVERDDPFTDMDGHWAEPYVTKLYQLGLTSGYEQEDGTFVFRPDGKLTRGELLTFITRLLGVDPALYEDVELPFADEGSIADWLKPYVKAMYALQVFNGTEIGGQLYADVGSNVTREAAMTMLGRVLKESRSADLSGFGDADQVSGWARAHVETLVGLGIVEGSGGLLTPKAEITRGAAAKLLVEVYALEKADLIQRGEKPSEAEQPNVPGVEPAPNAEPSQPDWGDSPTFVNPVDPVDIPVRDDQPADQPAISDPWNWSLPI